MKTNYILHLIYVLYIKTCFLNLYKILAVFFCFLFSYLEPTHIKSFYMTGYSNVYCQIKHFNMLTNANCFYINSSSELQFALSMTHLKGRLCFQFVRYSFELLKLKQMQIANKSKADLSQVSHCSKLSEQSPTA